MPGVTLEVFGRRGREGEVVRLSGTKFVFGRGGDCDVQIESDVASREHAQLHYKKGRWVIVDLGSSNGTFVNKVQVESKDVKPRDVVTIGKTGWKVRIAKLDPTPDGTSPNASTREIGGPPPKKQKKRKAAPPPHQPQAQYAGPPPAQSRGSGLPMGRIGFAVGVAFGLLIHFGAFDELKIRLPEMEIIAPCVWLINWLAELSREFVLENAELVGGILIALWFGLFGWFLFKIFRLWAPLLVMTVAHVAAIGFMPTKGGGDFGFEWAETIVLIALGAVAGLALFCGVISRMRK